MLGVADDRPSARTRRGKLRRRECRHARRRRALERPALARRDAAAARDAATAGRVALSAVHRRSARRRDMTPDRIPLRSESHRHRRHADRRRFFGRSHHRAGRAGARAEDRGLLHRAPGSVQGAGDLAQRGRRTARSVIGCSSVRSCGWPRSPSSTSRAGASKRLPARCRPARARNTTGPVARRRATSACRIPFATVPTRCSIPPSITTRCPRR